MKRKLVLLPLSFVLFFSSMVFADVRIGTVYFYPPFVLSTNDGFDIQLVQLLCQRMKDKCTFIPMDFNKLFPALEKGQIDMAVGGISISPAHEGEYLYSLPYMLSEGQFLTLKGSTYKSINDLKGTTVGVIRGDARGGVFYTYLYTKYMNFFQINTYDDMEDIINALSNNKISAAFMHEPTAIYWVENGGGQFQTLDKPISVGDGIGVIALPKSQTLIYEINQQMQNIEKDNTYLNLYKTYFGSN